MFAMRSAAATQVPPNLCTCSKAADYSSTNGGGPCSAVGEALSRLAGWLVCPWKVRGRWEVEGLIGGRVAASTNASCMRLVLADPIGLILGP